MPTGARDPRRGSSARWVFLGAMAVLVAWIFVSGVVLWSARQRTNDGLDALEHARATIDAGGVLRGAATRDLRDAKKAFADARSLTGGPVMAPWPIVPLLGGNVRSMESLTSAAERVSSVATKAADRSRELLDQHPMSGAERLAMLGDLAKVTRDARRSLRHVDLGPDFFVVAPLGDARERFVGRFDQLRSSLVNASEAAESVERLMRGPRTYLVLAANNAEMRGGSGVVLSAGVATFQDGDFSLGDMRPTSDFDLAADAVRVPDDLERLWGFEPVGEEWRWLGTTPRFDVSAPLAARMWEASTGQRVDGVLVVDSVGVRALLDAQGPIEVDGQRLSADDVVSYLLRQQYAFIDSTDPEQLARRDKLSGAVRSAMDTLSDRAWNPDRLVRSLTHAGRGRHVLAWARDPGEERAWKTSGLGGELRLDSLAVSILNTAGNKLDPFLRVNARLEVVKRSDRGHGVTVTLRFRNEAPDGLPVSVAGPNPGTGLTAGEYEGLVVVNTPGLGSLPKLDGVPKLFVTGRDGPTKVVGAGHVRLEPGAATRVTVHVIVPEGLEQIVVEPSARVPPISWRSRGERWDDTRSRVIELDRESESTSSPVPLSGGDVALLTVLGLGALAAGLAIVLLSRRTTRDT